MAKLLAIPAAILLLLAGVLAWSNRGGTVGRADFTFINRGEVNTLDPNRMSWMQDIRIGYALWEGLYALDPVTTNPVPGAADRIDVSPDGKTWTFHLRPDGRWSNGDVVTTADFVFAWRRSLDDPGDYTYLFNCIIGAQVYSDAKAAKQPADFAAVGIRAIDATTLQVTLEHPVPYFRDLCAFPAFFPLNERSMRPFHNDQASREAGHAVYDSAFTRPPALVTNGPYRLAAWEFKRRMRLEANAYYWDRANVRSHTIDQLSADDPLAAFLTYDTGGADWMAEVTGDVAAELRAKGRADLHIFPSFGTYFYSLNCRPKFVDGRGNPLADARVRQALSMAIDKRVIVDTISRLGEQAADTYIPRGVFPGYPQPAGLGFDATRAQRLLADAGYPDGQGFPNISLLFNQEGIHGEVAQNVVKQWQRNLHVSVGLEGVEIKIFRQRLHAKDYAIARASWYGDYNDPSTFTDKYLSDSENNDSDWRNAKYDASCQAAAVELNPAKRLRDFADAEGRLLDAAPIIPLYFYVNSSLTRSNVHGLPQTPRNMQNLKSVWVER